MKQRLMLLAMVSLVAAIVGWSVRAQSSRKVTWEYDIVSTYGPSITNPPPNLQQLNRAGEQGWELVEIRSGEFPNEGSKQYRTDYYLKRAK